MQLILPHALASCGLDDQARKDFDTCLSLPSQSNNGDLVAIAGTITGVQRPQFGGFHRGVLRIGDAFRMAGYRDLLEVNERVALKLAHLCAVAHSSQDLLSNLLWQHEQTLDVPDGRIYDEAASTIVMVGAAWAALLVEDHATSTDLAHDADDYQFCVSQSMVAIAEGSQETAHEKIEAVTNLREPELVLKSNISSHMLPSEAELSISLDDPARFD